MVYLSITISYPSTQFEELYGPFVNLGVHLPPKDNSLIKKHYIIAKLTNCFEWLMINAC